MKILVYGAGAVGSYFGGFLAKAGHEVSLLGRPLHIDVIRERGLEITGTMGEHQIRNFKLFTDVGAIQESPDLILLTVKPKDTENCAGEISECGIRSAEGGMPPILSIQNGLGNLEILSKYLPAFELLAGRLITSISIEPGKIKVGASADDFLIGAVGAYSNTPLPQELQRVEKLAEMFTKAGIKSRAVKDIQKYLWSKMVFNTSLNGLASLLEVTYGELLQSDETKEIIRNLVLEIYTVAEKKGISLEPETPQSHLQLLFDKLMPTFNNHRPSLFRAIQAGKKTDIDFLNGAISRFGMERGIKTPVNDAIANLIKAKEKFYSRNSKV